MTRKVCECNRFRNYARHTHCTNPEELSAGFGAFWRLGHTFGMLREMENGKQVYSSYVSCYYEQSDTQCVYNDEGITERHALLRATATAENAAVRRTAKALAIPSLDNLSDIMIAI